MYLVNKILHLVTVHQINANILNDTKHSTINHTDKVMLKHRNELVLHQIKSNQIKIITVFQLKQMLDLKANYFAFIFV